MQSLTSTFSSQPAAQLQFHMYSGPPSTRPVRMPRPTPLTPSHLGEDGTNDSTDLGQLLLSCQEDITQLDCACSIPDFQVVAHTPDTTPAETLNDCPLNASTDNHHPPVSGLTGVEHGSAQQLHTFPHELAFSDNDCQADGRWILETLSQDAAIETWGSGSPAGLQPPPPAQGLAIAALSDSHPSPLEDAVLREMPRYIDLSVPASSRSPVLAMHDSPHLFPSRCDASMPNGPPPPIPRLLSSPPSSAGQEACHSTCGSPAGRMAPDQAIMIRTPVRQLDSAAEVSVTGSDAEGSRVAESSDGEDGPPVRPRRRTLRQVAKASRRLRRQLTTPCPAYPDPPDPIERGAARHRHRCPRVDHASAPNKEASSTTLRDGNQSFGLDARIICQGTEGVGLLMSLPHSLISSLYAAAQQRDRIKQTRAGSILLEVGVDGMDASPSARKSSPRLRQQHRRERTLRPYSDKEDKRLLELKEQTYPPLPWKEIAKRFPGRTQGALQVRYCRVLNGQ